MVLEALGINTAGWGTIAGQIWYWGWIAFWSAVLIGAIAAYAWYRTYKYKMYYIEVVGSGKEGFYSINGKLKSFQFRWNKAQTAWEVPLKKQTLKPFPNEYFYPGNTVYAFKFGQEYVPASIQFDNTVGGAKIKSIQYYIQDWQKLKLRENQIEFSKKGFWEENKFLFATVICIAIMCVFAGVVIYYSLTKSAQVTGGLNMVAEAIRGVQGYAGAPA